MARPHLFQYLLESLLELRQSTLETIRMCSTALLHKQACPFATLAAILLHLPSMLP